MKSKPEDDQEKYYLDEMGQEALKFIRNNIVHKIARQSDSLIERDEWSKDIAFAFLLGILAKLAKRYKKDVKEFAAQAQMIVDDFVIEDLINNPKDNLSQRKRRWIEKCKEIPKYTKRKITKAERLKFLDGVEYYYHKLQSVFTDEIKLKNDRNHFKKVLKEAIPDISKAVADELSCELMGGFDLYKIAALYMARKHGYGGSSKEEPVNYEHLKKRYLRPARKYTGPINKALKYR